MKTKKKPPQPAPASPEAARVMAEVLQALQAQAEPLRSFAAPATAPQALALPVGLMGNLLTDLLRGLPPEQLAPFLAVAVAPYLRDNVTVVAFVKALAAELP